jgi:IPT/TIG domain
MQSSITVTPHNPSPPTNFGTGYANTGVPTSLPPNLAFADSVYGTITPGGDPWHPGKAPNTVPPYLDDGTAGTDVVFAAPNSGAAAEGAGTEVVVTQTYASGIYNPAGPMRSFSCLGNFTGVANPSNQQHASSLSPLGAQTLTTAGPSTASGTGNATVTATGTNFTPQSVIWVNGIAYPTTFVSATSLTASAPKKATAGTLPVYVVTGGATTTATVNWTFT